MAMIRYATREITAKLVYYGPGLSGKTTNLVEINRLRPGGRVGDMISLATEGDRTLYFDLLPMNVGTIAGFKVRFQLFTVPGQTHYNKTRKEVLREADGVVFVADSQCARREANIESLANLRSNLKEVGLDYETIPLVLQLNKRDVEGTLSVAELLSDLRDREVEHFEAVAVASEGVVETLSAATRAILQSLDARYNVYGRSPSPPRPDRPAAPSSAPRTSPVPSPDAPRPPSRPRKHTAVALPKSEAALAELRRMIVEDRSQRQRDQREILESIQETRQLVEALLASERRRQN